MSFVWFLAILQQWNTQLFLILEITRIRAKIFRLYIFLIRGWFFCDVTRVVTMWCHMHRNKSTYTGNYRNFQHLYFIYYWVENKMKKYDLITHYFSVFSVMHVKLGVVRSSPTLSGKKESICGYSCTSIWLI